MSVLTFILPIVILLVLALLLIGMGTRKAQENIRMFLSTSTAEPFTIVTASQAFDPDYSIIWDTQIPALNLVEKEGRRGLPLERLFLWYSESARHYPELYDGSSFGRWMEFLEREELVTTNGFTAFITAEGQEFLAYRIAAQAVVRA